MSTSRLVIFATSSVAMARSGQPVVPILWSRKLAVIRLVDEHHSVCDDPVFYFFSFMIKIIIAPTGGVAVEIAHDNPSVWVRLKNLGTQLLVGCGVEIVDCEGILSSSTLIPRTSVTSSFDL